MNKKLLLEKIIITLEKLREHAVRAAMQAYDTATADENIAENKYDTLGLEASYLAQGQAQRVAECEDDIDAYKLLLTGDMSVQLVVSIGSLVHIVNEQNIEQWLFLGPKSGGLTLTYQEAGEAYNIQIITPSSPLGSAMLKREEGDEFELLIGQNKHCYEILSIN